MYITTHKAPCLLFLAIFIVVPCSTSIDIQYLKEVLLISYAAYDPGEAIAAWTCYWCIGDNSIPMKVDYLAYEKAYETFAFIGHHADTIFVSFRGTNSLVNLLNDVAIFKIKFPGVPGGSVHYGIYKSYLSIAEKALAGVNLAYQNCPNCNKVVATGHSLGGALATLFTLNFSDSALVKSKAYGFQSITFGEPRFGNKAFSKYIDSKLSNSIRFINKRDIIPHLPSKFLGYVHHLQEVWIDLDDLVHVCSTTCPEDMQCSNSLGWMYNLHDHHTYFGYDITSDKTRKKDH